MAKYLSLTSGSLWQHLRERTVTALEMGTLQHIDTREQIVTDNGIPFVVRVAKSLQRKREEKHINDARRPDFNPFLPPETALTVGAIGEEHLAVLNKYNVVEHHLLIVTRQFEPQEALLTLGDFEALCWALQELDGFGFYNGGTIAGASQRHKHLQLIPLPLTAGQTGLPIDQVLQQKLPIVPDHADPLPFPHRIASLPSGLFDAPNRAAAHCQQLYYQMLAELGIPPVQGEGFAWQSAPYNLLLTRRWMMLIPRRKEHYDSISINAMGFGGSLFVRNSEELERVKKAGPMAILQAVSGSIPLES